jgi:hypothetical protein
MTLFWKKTLLFLLLAGVLGYFLAIWGERKLLNLVEEKIAANGILKYRKMDISLLAGNVSFTDASINWKWPEQGKHFNLLSPEIRLDGIGWRRLYFDKKLNIRSFHLQSPDVTVRDIPIDSSASTFVPDSIAGLPKVSVLALEIGSATLDGGCVEVYTGKENIAGRPTVWANSMFISLDDLAFNLQADEMMEPVFGEADLLLQDVAMNDRQDRHRYFLQKFHLNKRDSLIEISGIKLDPKDTPAAFFNQMSYKKAWIDLSLPSAIVHGWNFGKLLQGEFVARTASLEGLEMKVRANQNLQPDPNAYRSMPQEMIRDIPVAFTIDSIEVKKGSLVFENIGPGKTEVGVITFDPITALITNLTNDSARIAQQKMMELDAVGYCQGKHPVYNHFWFDLASPVSAFSFKGNAAKIPFVNLNSFIKPCTDVFFDDGVINNINFEVNADNRLATGSLHMDYENLDFSLLNDDRERRKLLSKVVDLLFIKEDNDNKDKDFQTGNIYLKRDVRLPFLNYWWTAIQSGIKTTLLDGMLLKQADKRIEKKAARLEKKANKQAKRNR